MIRAALLLFGASTQLIAPAGKSMIDWQGLPMLPYRTPPAIDRNIHEYVGREAAYRRCPVARLTDGSRRVQADVAVLLGPGGVVRTTIPRAIHCPTIEQFAAGFVESSARENLRLSMLSAEGGWYRATLVFTWRA